MTGNYADWHTKQQAADLIGVSTKTVEKLAKEGKLQHRLVPQQGKPAMVLYHPAEVAQLRRERNPEPPPYIVPPEGGLPDSADLRPATRSSPAVDMPVEGAIRVAEAITSAVEMIVQRRQELGAAEQRNESPKVRLAEQLYLTLKEASEYSGLPRVFLKKLIADGKLTAITVTAAREKRIRRTDLEQLQL